MTEPQAASCDATHVALRLGPGRIHHCMHSIDQARRVLETMCRRVGRRSAFGNQRAEQGSIRQDMGRGFRATEPARLPTLKTVDTMDKHGNKGAKNLIAACTMVTSTMAQGMIARTVQTYGGRGVSNDTEPVGFWAATRFVRMADRPDKVHLAQVDRQKLAELAALPANGRSTGRRAARPGCQQCRPPNVPTAPQLALRGRWTDIVWGG